MTTTLIELRFKQQEAARRMLPIWRVFFANVALMQAESAKRIELLLKQAADNGEKNEERGK